MEALKESEQDQDVQRGILKGCPEKFLKEMCEVITRTESYRFRGVPLRGKKKYYLDKLTRENAEKLPTARVKREGADMLKWLEHRGKNLEYYEEWVEYLRGYAEELAVAV